MSRLPVAAMPSTCHVSYDLDLVDGHEELTGHRRLVVVDLAAQQHPVGMADAGGELPAPRQRVRALAGRRRPAGRVDGARREHERLRAEDLVLELLGEHREQPVVLHVEGGDPAHRRVGVRHGEADVDEGRQVDLVAAVARGHERTEHTGRLQRLDHLVERAALRLRLERRRRDERRERPHPFEQPLGGQVAGVSRCRHCLVSRNSTTLPSGSSIIAMRMPGASWSTGSGIGAPAASHFATAASMSSTPMVQ